MELFVHTRGKDVELHDADPSQTVQELAVQHGTERSSVWLEGADDPLEADVALQDAGVNDRANVHVGVCKQVTVGIRFNQRTITYEVPPAATLQSLYARATSAGEGFGFGDVDRAQYTLQIQGTTEQPDHSRHVGVFADDHCAATFDLVLQDRFQG
jgi:hypothetical protein